MIADRFDRVAARQGARPTIVERGESVSYAELRRRSEAVSRCLAPFCRAPGQRVGLMVPNSAAYVAAFFGIVRLGGVVAPLNVRYRSQELAYYLEDTRAAALVAPPALIEVAREALGGVAHPPALVAIDEAAECTVVAPGDADPLGAASGDSPPLLHQYTSGSTGKPKRVIRTHAQLAFELERLTRTFAVDGDDRFLGATPFTHVNGLVRTMLTSMHVGATLYPMAEFKRREALDLITRERLTYFGGVPSMFIVLADTPVRGTVDLTSLRTVFSASAPLVPDDNRRFAAKYGVHPRQLYGSTETGTISVNVDADPTLALASVGHPLPDVRIEVVDDHGAPAAADIEGEVTIASPGAITAYDGNAEATAASFRAGFYLSGDLGRKDARGALTLTGRKKFLINRGGFKVNPLEVEEAIRAHPRVREVVVLAAPSPHGDDLVRAVIVADGACAADEIVAHCAPRIADFKIPSRIEFRDALPKTETGKILRSKL
ncbi:MAG TPA: class I adenylate-forming enzyme family protein [Candidatus Binatia bacterium]